VKSRVNRARTKLSQILTADPKDSPLKPGYGGTAHSALSGSVSR